MCEQCTDWLGEAGKGGAVGMDGETHKEGVGEWRCWGKGMGVCMGGSAL